MLELRGITAGYPGRQILNELSLSVPEGQLAVVVGPNGCGKSTLLKTVAGILPSAGEILLDGISIPALSSRERARQIAFLPQNRPVPEITAEGLVLHGRFPWVGYPRRYRQEDREAAARAMEQLGIGHLRQRHLPELSGGERQKVYIAMLLAQQTRVILMDEPTASLDIANKFELMEVARKLADRGKTVLVVLHDLDLAMQYADLVAVMADGRICRTGTPEEIFRSGILQQVFHIRTGEAHTPMGTQYYFLPERLCE